MDPCCATLKTSSSLTHPVQVRSGSIRKCDNGFYGEEIRGSLKSSASTELWKGLKTENQTRKVKYRVACSILTSDIDKEIVVSDSREKQGYKIMDSPV